MKLYGTRAIVTGGGRGIGRAMTLALADAGADVVITYRHDEAAAARTAAEVQACGRTAVTVYAEMGDPASLTRLVSESERALGGVDILVCNAGMNRRTPFLDIPLHEWDEVLNADLRGPFVLGQAVARRMADTGGGRIIFTTSISAEIAYRDLVSYQSAKAGLKMLMRGMAYELAPHGVTVNAIAPGVTETDLTRANLASPEHGPRRLAKIPMQRFGQPEDYAGAVVFLASEEARWTTGCTLTVDGGQTLQ